MRIAHVTATFPPYLGGTGNVAFQDARCLAQLGHDVTVFTANKRGSARAEPAGFNVRRLKTLFQIGNAPFIPGLLSLKRYDIVHLHYPFIFGAEMVLLLRYVKHQPYVLTYHNDLISPGLKGLLFDIYQSAWTASVVRAAQRVIVTSWDGASSSPIIGPMIQRHPDHYREIPNGVDLTLFKPWPDGSNVRARLGIEDATHVMLFVGTMDSAHHPKGGVPILLQAAARLRDVDLAVLLAGAGDRIGEYRALAEDLHLQAKVHFLGGVPNEELPEIYAASDVIVQPSLMFEPFGLVAIEAMACGKPVIASDLPGVRRVVTEAGGGILAEPGSPDDLASKIRTVLSDDDLRRELGLAGRRGVEARYDWGRIGPMLVTAYEEALTA